MLIEIIALIVLILFSISIAMFFFINIIELIINLFVLWAVCLRGYVEIKKEKKHIYYFIGLLISIALFMYHKEIYTFANSIHAYWPVLFILFVFLIAQITMMIQIIYTKFAEKYRK